METVEVRGPVNMVDWFDWWKWL